MASPITVQGIAEGSHSCKEYTRIDIYVQGNPIALIHRDVHIVDGLKAKFLIGMDIIGPESIIINVQRRIAIIGSCSNAEIEISVTPRAKEKVNRCVKAKGHTTIPARSHIAIPVHTMSLPNDRDLLFEPTTQPNGIAIYAHIVNCQMTTEYAHNDTDSPATLFEDTPLGSVIEYEADACFAASPEFAILAATSNTKGKPPTKPRQHL